MSSLKLGQVAELTERVRARLAEFGEDVFDLPSLGVIRLVYDVIEEWREEQEFVLAAAPGGESLDIQLTEGVQIGRQLVALRRDANRRIDPDYNLIKIRTDDAPRFAPATIADAHTNGGIANANGSTAGDVAAPEPTTLSFVHVAPPDPPGMQIVAAASNIHAPQPISAEAATALGVEHTLVTPLKPRTLAEVDADEKRFAQLGSDEKAAQLRAIVNELRMLSAHGEMPSMADWDEKKPEDLPRATTLLQRHKLTWGQLAQYADLGFDLNERRGRRHNRESVAA